MNNISTNLNYLQHYIPSLLRDFSASKHYFLALIRVQYEIDSIHILTDEALYTQTDNTTISHTLDSGCTKHFAKDLQLIQNIKTCTKILITCAGVNSCSLTNSAEYTSLQHSTSNQYIM